MVRSAGFALLLLAACDDGARGVSATLAELPGLGIAVIVESQAVGKNYVHVVYDDMAERFPDECPILGDDFAGRFRGRVMTVADRGGAGDIACEPLALEIDASAVPSNNVVEVMDGSLLASGTFESTALETRVATHESWQFVRGEPAAIDWSHPADLVGATPAILLGDRELAAASSGTQISFTLPDDAATGTIDIVVESNDMTLDDANRCDNAATCRATQIGLFQHVATIE